MDGMKAQLAFHPLHMPPRTRPTYILSPLKEILFISYVAEDCITRIL